MNDTNNASDDAAIFDATAFRLSNKEAELTATARQLGQSVLAGAGSALRSRSHFPD